MNPILTPRQRQLALFMVLLNAFSTPLMLSAANVALPTIAQSLQMTAVMLSWVPMAFLMASAMFVLIFGRLADMFGRKRIFLLGSFAVVLSSVGAALASTGEQLLFFRFLQGISGAMLQATQVALISSIFPPEERGKNLGVMISTLYFGLTCGPLLGGVLVDALGWRIVFVFHIPIALLVLYLGLYKVPGDWLAEKVGSFDWSGALVYLLGLAAIAVGVSYFQSIWGVVALVAGFAAIALFIRIERRVLNPMLDVSLFFNNRVFLQACSASLIMYTATFANVVLVSLYLQYLRGIDVAQAGLIMMVQPLAMSLFSPLAGRWSDRINPRYLVYSGMGLNIAGLGLMTQFSEDTSLLWIVIPLAVSGLGFSLFSSPNINSMMGAVTPAQYGVASGVNSMVRVVGQLTSMIMVTLMMSFFIGSAEITRDNYEQLAEVVNYTFSLAAILCFVGLLLSVPRIRMRAG